jgi:uncharacterized protein YjbI with pentapeptide repeats
MTDQTGVEWPTCDEDGCIGVQLARGGKCLAHTTARRRNATLGQFGRTGAIDASGVPITQALLDQILAAAPLDTQGHPTFIAAIFDRATFQGFASFHRATFRGLASFEGVTFRGLASFYGATFKDRASFDGATFLRASFEGVTFQNDASFYGVTFKDTVGFPRAAFDGDASFERAAFQGSVAWFEGAAFRGSLTWFAMATFHGNAGFDGVTFRGVGFDGATFHGDARFYGATFRSDAEFIGAVFRGDVGFDRATFHDSARFDEARFEQARQLGPLLVYGVLRLDAAHFAQLIQIEVSTRGLSCQQTRFPAGVQFRLRGAQIVLDDTDLPSPSILVGIAALSDAKLARREQQLVQAVRRLAPQAAMELSARPRLLSVQGANVAGLTISNVDMAECRFAGAHNLDRLRLEARVTLATAPSRLPWDKRRVIAEERARRAALDRSGRWLARQWWPAWLHHPFGKEWPGVLPAGQIAGLYRALRKGREDAKDEPDAADFYYGEMEMRRHAGRQGDSSSDHPTGELSRGQVERAILTVYWLVSGYGLRAWRALAWLAAMTAGFAVAFHLVGFTRPPQPVSYWTSLLYAFRATLSLTDNAVELTAWGKLLQGLLRLTGPVLLGLTLLAIRARTKR